MNITHSFTADLKKPNHILCLYMVQNDKNSRTISASLYVDESPWDIPTEVVVSLAYRKPDGTNGLYSSFSDGSPAGSVSGNTASIKIKPQVLSIAGVVTASIVLTTGEETLATFPIYLQVEENPGSKSPDPEPDFDYETLYDINNVINGMKLSLNSHMSNTDNPHKVTCSQLGAATEVALQTHIGDKSNPHEVTCSQIGAASQEALDSHTGNTGNPHGVTPAQIGAVSTTGGHYIKEAKESGSWGYRLWEDGFAECWTKNETTVTGSAPSPIMGGYLTTATVQLPISFAAGKTNTVLNAKTSTGVGFGYGVVLGGNQLKIYCTGNANTTDIKYQAYVTGYWM